MVAASPAGFVVALGYAAAIGLAGSLATYGLVSRTNRVARSFSVLMLALLVWTLGALGRLLAPTRTVWYGLTAVMFLGVAATAVLFFVFVTYYTNRGRLLDRRRVAALFFVPLVTMLAIGTNSEHGLFFGGIRTVAFGGDEVFFAASGPLFWVHAAYSYLLLVVGTAFLVEFALDSSRAYRRQSLAILGGTAMPWATNIVYVFYAGPSFPVDPTPVGFAVGGLFLGYAVFGVGVTNLTPAARSAVVDAIDDAVFVVGRDDEVVDLNPAARRLAAVTDPVGDPVPDVIPDPVLRADDDPSPVTVAGEERWYRLREVALGDEGRVLLASELTEQVRRERQLREQNRRLEQFTRIAAHDLRNPLNAITGYTRLARETGDVSHLDDVDPAADRIETLIDDLLTLGREGRVVEETVPVSLGETAESAWEAVDTGGATLEVVDDQRLLADEGRLQQLLENLLANAVTHGGDDTTVRVGPTADGFFVADDGPGIPPEERAEVFEYGYSTHGGTGLGLPVVGSIAVAHGWEVSITEAVDGGARFEFDGVQTDPDLFDGLRGVEEPARSPRE